MSQSQEFKVQLENKLVEVTSGLEAIAVKNPETNDWVAVPVPEDLKNSDQNVEADAVEEWEARRALMTQLEIRYRNIVRALEKIEAGTFGVCEISGEPIEPERLAANPAARTNLANIDRESELTL